MKRRKAGLAQSAQRFLEPGETVLHVYVGQTFVSPLTYLLIAPFVFVFVAKQRAVIVTDRRVRVMRPNFWKAKQVDEELASFPVADATVEATRFGLSVNGGQRLYAFLFGFGDMKETAAAVERARGGGAIPQAV